MTRRLLACCLPFLASLLAPRMWRRQPAFDRRPPTAQEPVRHAHGKAPHRPDHEVAGQRVLQDDGRRRSGPSEGQRRQYDLIVNGIKDERDLARQVALVDEMIAQRVDAIVIAPADSKALVSACKRAA